MFELLNDSTKNPKDAKTYFKVFKLFGFLHKDKGLSICAVKKHRMDCELCIMRGLETWSNCTPCFIFSLVIMWKYDREPECILDYKWRKR